MKEYKLTEVCDFQGGTQPPKSEWINEARKGYVRMLQIRDFTQGKAQHIEYVKDSNKVNKCKVEDILVARYGASIGKIVTGLEGAYNVALIKTIPNENLLTKKFLQSVLKSPVFQNFILSIGARAAQAGFNKEDLSRFKIFLPSLQEQIRIAEILIQAENLITQRKESILLLDELLKSTFLEMFGTHTQPKFETDSIQNLSIKITDGTHQSPKFLDEGVPFLLVSNIINNEINYKTKKFISEIEYLELNKRTPIEIGDILITSVGSYGNPALVKTVTKFAFQRHIAYIKPDHNKINNVFLFGALKSSFVKIQIDKAVRGVAQLTLNLSELKKIQIPIPPVEIQNKFATIVEKVDELRKEYQASLKELENMHGVLSQKAFKGELKVEEIV